MTQAFDQNLTPSDLSRDGQNDSQMRSTAASQWNNADGFRSAIRSMTGGDTTNGALPHFSINQGDHCHGHGGHGGSYHGREQNDPVDSLHDDVSKLGQMIGSFDAGLNGSGSGLDAQKMLSTAFTQLSKDVDNLSSDLESLTTILNKFGNSGTVGGDSPKQGPGTIDQSTGSDGTTPSTGDHSTGDGSTPSGDGATQNPTSGDQTTTSTAPPAGPNSGFSIASGKLTVNGKTLAGVAVTGEYAQQVGAQTLADQISSQFPGINVVRLATSPEGGAFTGGQTFDGAETLDNINQTISALNAKGIGVIIDNHDFDANTPNNVAQTGSEAAWFSQIAAAQTNNNMVMFQTENEPMGSDADVAAEQQKAYNAIRNTENETPGSVQHVVAFDLVGGGYAGPQQNYASVYNAMSNYVIDAHAYASNNDDPVSAIQAEVAQTAGLTEADGSKVPVSIFETGNSIDGSDIDPKATELLNYVYPTYGAVAWLYDGAATGFNSNGADHLTDANGNLTSLGNEIQSLIAAS